MPGYISPEEYGLIKSQDWEEPISLESVDLPEFPVDALPKPIAAFVLEVSEMLQVYPDMPAFCALGVLSLCFQKKFAVRVNEDWLEPINLYLLVVADPSERKSPCLKEMTAPVRDFEEIWNRDHEAEIELSHEVKSACSAKRELARKNLAKGKGTEEELAAAVNEDLEFIPKEKIRLFLDDVTPEKLTAQMASNGGVCSIMSAEGGVFRNFAGGYSGSTNCDTLLKAYSADPIRVDRMTRTGETISSPALTLLIMMQPKVLSSLMSNEDFLGRGLNARILWSFSASYRVLGKPEYLAMATRAKDYILEHFLDPVYGGTYWELDYKGNPIDTKKQFYALGFMLYGMSEYVRAIRQRPDASVSESDIQKVLGVCINLFTCIEEHSLDEVYNGYIEACTREWGEIADMRLSELDANYPKSQNTHLHIIEPG